MKKLLILILVLLTGIAQAQVTPTELMGLGMAPALSSKVASIGNGSRVRASNGTALLPAFSFASRPSTGIYSADVNQLSYTLGGTLGYFMTASTLAPFPDATRELGQGTYRFTSGNFSAYVRTGVTATVSAAGSALADSTLLANANNIITTVAASTGVRLPASGVGSTVRVQNLGASDLKLYPNTALGNINSAADGVAITLAAATDDIAECVLYNSGSDLWSCARYAGPAS